MINFEMNFLSTLPQSSKNLPCTLIPLNDWRLIKINGADTIQYLQGQLTCDLHSINTNQYAFAAHCNPRGKMINNMYIFQLNSSIALIQRYDICDKQITEMKKYAIFSKVTINLDNYVSLFGVAGFNSRKILKKFFKKIPDIKTTVVRNLEVIILHFNLPQERFLLIFPNLIKTNIVQTLTSKMKISNNLQWTALDIESGYPIITYPISEKLIPQEANMHLLGGISFNKGCYIGQEIIARTQYKNINKRSLHWLIGNDTDNLPQPGNKLEIKINNSWKSTGLILKSCRIKTGEVWIQAVLHNPIKKNTSLRIMNDKNNLLKISPLPYSIFHD